MDNKKLAMISWNVAGRKNKCPEQIKTILDLKPDLIALQEIIKSTRQAWLSNLAEVGYFVQTSYDLAEDKSVLKGGRKYSVIIASRWPMVVNSPSIAALPWPERYLSVKVASPWGAIECHNVHMPAGVSQGDTKPETFQGIYKFLSHHNNQMRILCGDFNSPKQEFPDGRIITWGKTNRDECGRLVNDLSDRKARSEHLVFNGLKEFDLKDVYRQINGYDSNGSYSWIHKWRDHRTYRRFDHIFASSELNPIGCKYHHQFLDWGLSDHAPISAVFEPRSGS